MALVLLSTLNFQPSTSLAIETIATDAQGNQLPLRAKPATPGATPYPANFRSDVKLDGTNLLDRIEDAAATGGGGGGSALPDAVSRGIDKEIYIALRTDLVPVAGTGTKEDPYDGSTAVKFDALMVAISANAAIHLEPGTFLTTGNIFPKEGWRLHGAGKDLTVLKLADNTATVVSPQKKVIYGWGPRNYFEIANMTIDCNSANQPAVAADTSPGWIDAIQVYAKSAKALNVRVRNPWVRGVEGFPFAFFHDGTRSPYDRIEIDGCEVIDPSPSPVTGMTAFTSTDQYWTRISTASGATTNGGTTITTAAGGANDFFVSTDVGRDITGTGITSTPPTTITAVTNSHTATISQAATATGSSLVFTIPQGSVHTVIKNCRVTNPPGNNAMVAYGSTAAPPHPVDIINNYSYGAAAGALYDTGNFANLTLAGNRFLNCASNAIVVYVTAGTGKTTTAPSNINIVNNVLETTPTGYGPTLSLLTGSFKIEGNTLINRNGFGKAISPGALVAGEFSGNIIDELVASDLSLILGLNAHDNHDPAGKFKPMGKSYVSPGAPTYFAAAPYASLSTSTGDVIMSTAATGVVGATLTPTQRFRVYNDGGMALDNSLNSPGANKFRLKLGGIIGGSQNSADALAESTFTPTTAARKAMVIKAITGQTENLLEIKNNVSVLGTWFGPDGKIHGDLSGGTMAVTSITGVRQPVSTSTYAVAASDYLLAFTATNLNQTATLPAGAGSATYIFTDESMTAAANNKTIATTGGQLIDGVATLVLSANGATARVYWTGTGWHAL